MRGTVTKVSVSKGGVPKLAVAEAWAGPLGLEGDHHRNTQLHGGPRKALLLVAQEDLAWLSEQGFPVSAGSLGENLTVEGIDFRQLRNGQRFRAGGAVIELTKPRQPCSTLDIYNGGEAGKIQRILLETHARAGYYAAVIQAGPISPGDIIELVDQIV